MTVIARNEVDKRGGAPANALINTIDDTLCTPLPGVSFAAPVNDRMFVKVINRETGEISTLNAVTLECHDDADGSYTLWLEITED